MTKWRIIYVGEGLWNEEEQAFMDPWFVCRPDGETVHFACKTLDDAVDIAIRSMALLERVTIRDRMQ